MDGGAETIYKYIGIHMANILVIASIYVMGGLSLLWSI